MPTANGDTFPVIAGQQLVVPVENSILLNDIFDCGTIETYFLTFNGTTSYGELADAWISTDGDWTAEIVFEGNAPVTAYGNLVDASSLTNRFTSAIRQSDNTLGFNSSIMTAVLDGTAYTTNTINVVDGKLHTLELTGTSIAELKNIGQDWTAGSYFDGIIKSLTLTDNTTPANSREYTIDSQSIVYEGDDLNPSDTTKRILYNNVVAGDWSGVWTYNATSGDCAGGAGWEHATETTICKA